MQVIRGFDRPAAYRGGFVSIGNFDGVHRGHRAMLAALIDDARSHRVPAVVFTFDPHPIAILRPASTPPPLTTTTRKLHLFQQCGVDTVLVYPTDEALLRLTAREFFDEIICHRLTAAGLVEGPNFYFGHDRAGTIEILREFCTEAHKSLKIIPPVYYGEQLVSSTTIRTKLLAGEVTEAGELLGEPYRLQGSVGRGAQRGRTMGFPTANLERIATIIPPDGVYAGRCQVVGKTHAVALNIGPNPTFGEVARKVEAHLLDFSGDLYGAELEIEMLARLRETTTFSSVSALQGQLREDVATAARLASTLFKQ